MNVLSGGSAGAWKGWRTSLQREMEEAWAEVHRQNQADLDALSRDFGLPFLSPLHVSVPRLPNVPVNPKLIVTVRR